MLQKPKYIAGLVLPGLLIISSCARGPSPQPSSNTQAVTPTPASETAKPQVAPGALRVGEASGSYTARGETVTLKYAYAGRAQRFGSESMVILLTDKEIPPDALADEIKNQTMLFDGKIRGLEYAIMKDSYWVRFHPGQYQESQSLSSLKEYLLENDVVRGSDEEKSDLTDAKYARSVKFVAAITK